MSRLPNHEETYSASHLNVIQTDLASLRLHIRRRPGVYIGGTGSAGLHHLASIVVDTLLDDVSGGAVKELTYELFSGGGCRMTGAGPGGSPELRLGPFSPETSYRPRVGVLRKIGLKAACVLSESFRVEARSGSRLRTETYRQGEIQERQDRELVGHSVAHRVVYEFRPDPTIFPHPDANFDAAALSFRLTELAFLFPAVQFQFSDWRGRPHSATDLSRPGGVVEYVVALNDVGSDFCARFASLHNPHACRVPESYLSLKAAGGTPQRRSPVHSRVFYADGRGEGFDFELAFQWTECAGPMLLTYANRTTVASVGPHQDGLRRAIRQTILKHGRYHGILKDEPITPVDYCAGLTLVLAMSIDEPVYGGATRLYLLNPEVGPAIRKEVATRFAAFMESYPAEATSICRHVLGAYARRAEKRRIPRHR